MALGLLDQLYANQGAAGNWNNVYNAAQSQGWNADQAANYVTSLGLGNVSSADVNNWLTANNRTLSGGSTAPSPTASQVSGGVGDDLQDSNSLINSIARNAAQQVIANPGATTNYGNAFNQSAGTSYNFNDMVNTITNDARQGYTANSQIQQPTTTTGNTNTGNYLTIDQLNSWWSQNNPMTNFSSQLDNWWNSKGLSNLYGSNQGVSAPRNAGNRSRYFNPSTGDYQGLGTMYAQPQSL